MGIDDYISIGLTIVSGLAFLYLTSNRSKIRENSETLLFEKAYLEGYKHGVFSSLRGLSEEYEPEPEDGYERWFS